MKRKQRNTGQVTGDIIQCIFCKRVWVEEESWGGGGADLHIDTAIEKRTKSLANKNVMVPMHVS